MSGDDTTNDEAPLRKALPAAAGRNQNLVAKKAELSTKVAALRTRMGTMDLVKAAPTMRDPSKVQKTSERNAVKRFSVLCLQCDFSVDRLIDA
jgi:hypothetical protein